MKPHTRPGRLVHEQRDGRPLLVDRQPEHRLCNSRSASTAKSDPSPLHNGDCGSGAVSGCLIGTVGMLCALALLPLSSACTIVAADGGELEIDWTLAATTKSSLCTAHDADELLLRVYDESDVLVAERNEDCDSFSLTVDGLTRGSYTVTAVLVNDDGNEVTSELGPRSVSIDQTDTTSLSFNFSSSTFLYTVDTGALLLEWSVAGSTNDAACESRRAEQLVVRLYDADDDQWNEEAAEDCTDFSVTVTEIPEGVYTVKARLENDDGDALTAWQTIREIELIGDRTTQRELDFDADLFVGSVASGELRLDWTIDGENEELWCELYDAGFIEFHLYDADGRLYLDPPTAPCESFSATLSRLPVGDYGIGAVLLDADGNVITSTIPPQHVAISEDNVTLQEFDFPEGSFF